jgi:uncharacterized protein
MKIKNKKLALIIAVFILLALIPFVSLLGNDKKETKKTSISSVNSNAVKETSSSYFIEQLRTRDYENGDIKIERTLSQNSSYTSYQISYLSDNLKIYGVMNQPQGNGPFPVIILNHGYYSTSQFQSGDGTEAMADILARQGYLTLASDYRGHGQSENDAAGRSGGHRPEYAIDVLNLIASVGSIDKASVDRIGMWGHSMGGEVSLRTIEATDKVKALALWAPTSGDASHNRSFYGGSQNPNSESDENYGISPIKFLKYISTPISLHQGLVDTEVDPDWSKQLNEALVKEAKPVEYFEYEGQDHNFRNLGWDLISERTLKFYDKYLK